MSASRRKGCRRRPQVRDQLRDVAEQISRDGDLSHLECDVAAVAHDLRAAILANEGRVRFGHRSLGRFPAGGTSRREFFIIISASIDDYLRSAVFFNVARFPDMRFVSTSVEKRDAQHALVTGDLTMLGVTRPISLDVEVARKLAGTNQRIGFKATSVINRLDFGMNSGYPLISDAIHLTVTTEASAAP